MSQLKTVEEYNAERILIREDAEAKALRTGVACPGCGGELLWVTPLAPNHSRFTPRQARCRKCDLDVALEG